MSTNEYTVNGMTCTHCSAAVKEKVEALPGVNGVEVELEGGRLAFNSEQAVDASQVAAAVADAGYELVAS